MASTSTTFSPNSPPPTPQLKHDVFLSFRGVDTRTSFTDHLYAALCQKGVFTFRDDEGLERGKPISELLKAIQESKIAVVILSRNYASSKWCLVEVAKIVECMNTTGQIVLPVFYHVEPSQVRKQTGQYEEDFAIHERVFKDDLEKVNKWRDALTQVANLSGWEPKERYESIVIQDIVEHILGKLNQAISNVPKDLVGMDSRIKEMELYLGIGLQDIRIIGILGIGGIGKTTLAEVIFERLRNQFEASSFIANVREKYAEKHGLVHMQEQLLNELLQSKVSVQSVNMGLNLIRKRLRWHKVIIILDDVDQLEQIEALAGTGSEQLYDFFGPGSRIIITTRNEHLLKTYGANKSPNKIYKVEKLTDDDALRLFFRKAFKKDHPLDDYVELCHKFVDYTDGLPLALEVLGSFLFDKSLAEWCSAFESLKDNPKIKIHHTLKVSFDGLETSAEKNIFLDIACFFKGENVKRVKRIFESCGYHPDISIRVLLDKSLVSILGGRLWMHDLLQEMGKEIVRGKSPEPGKRSRLWLHTDALDVLTNNMGTEAVEGIFLNPPQPDKEHLLADPLFKLHRLRLLKIYNVEFSGCLESLPNDLRFLDWQGCPLKSLPSSFKLNKLVELNISQSPIEQLWKEIRRPLEKLVIINLSDCEYLTKTPDFNAVPKLERLILKGCKRLSGIHPSIGVLQQLILLNLQGCECLSSLPSNINLRSLKVFLLSGCSKLKMFPEIGENMKQLSELHLDGTAIKELPTSIKHLNGLITLNLRDCKNLLNLPGAICTLTSLQNLNLSGCSKLDNLPEYLGSLERLQKLDVSRSAIRQVPSSILLLRNLELLSFAGCRDLIRNSWCSFFSCCLLPPEASTGLQLPSSFSGLCSLRTLDLSNCNLSEGAIPDDLGCLSLLQHFNLSENNFMSVPESICQLTQLEELKLNNCSKLQSLPTLPSSIRFVQARDCPVLQGTYSNKSSFFTSTAAGFCLIDCQKSDQELIVEPLPLATPLRRPFMQTFYEDRICHEKGFDRVIPGQTEIPVWFSRKNTGSSVTILLPPDLDGNSTWMGYALCFVCEEERDNMDLTCYCSRHYQDSFTHSSNYRCHLYTNHDDPLERPLVREQLDRHFNDASYGYWVYGPRELFAKRLNKRFIQASIIMDCPKVKVKSCGARLVYLKDVAEFVGNLSHHVVTDHVIRQSEDPILNYMRNLYSSSVQNEISDKSDRQEQEVASPERTCVAGRAYTSETRFLIQIEPHTSTKIVGQLRRNIESLLAELLKGWYARRYDYGFTLSLRAILPWFSHQSIGREVELPLPPGLYNDKEWVGFALYAAFTLPPGVELNLLDSEGRYFFCNLFTRTRNVEHFIMLVPHEDNLVGPHRLYVTHVPRLRFPEQLNQCDSIFVTFGSLTPGVEVEMCGIRVVYEQDLNGLIKTITHCTITSPPVYYQRDDKTEVVEKARHFACDDRTVVVERDFACIVMVKSLLEEAKSSKSDPLLRRLPSLENLPSTLDTSPAGIGQVIRLRILAETPFRDGYSVILWKRNLECLLQHFFSHPLALRVSLTLRGEEVRFVRDFDPYSDYGSFFYQKEIPEWCRGKSGTSWAMYPLPPNLGNDTNFMGVVICAAFSVLEHPPAVTVLKNIDSRLSYSLMCKFQISVEGCSPKAVSCRIFQNALMWLYVRGFIWLHYIPRERFLGHLNGQGHFVASMMSDYPGLAVQKCSLRLLYKQDVEEFTQTIIKCFTSIFENVDLFRRLHNEDFDSSSVYNACFPPTEILEWFGTQHQRSGHSITMQLPPNLNSDNKWIGLAVCAYFSVFDGQPTAHLDNLDSPGIPHHLICHLETDRASLEHPIHAYCTTNEELEWLYQNQQGGFIWVSYIPRQWFMDQLNECNFLEASIGSDRPGLRVHECGLRLVYKPNDLREFKRIIMHCVMISLSDNKGKIKQWRYGDSDAGSSSTTGNYNRLKRPNDTKGKQVME